MPELDEAGHHDRRRLLRAQFSYQDLAAAREQMQWYEQVLADEAGIWWALANSDDVLIGASDQAALALLAGWPALIAER